MRKYCNPDMTRASLSLRDFSLIGLKSFLQDIKHVKLKHKPQNSSDFQLYFCSISSVSAPSSESNTSVSFLLAEQMKFCPLDVNT